MTNLRLAELNAKYIIAANDLSLKPGQAQFIAPVTYSAAASVIDPSTAWQRVIVDDDTDEVVAFIHGHFDPNAEAPEFRAALWRILVDAEGQGRGIGRFAADALADEARARGYDELYVHYEPGEDGPGPFFTRIGFEPVGETPYGDVIARMTL
ncbi:GNAT family N-acetyltransferase [Pseudoclavibacter caeni]|jgi:diamine N-acetyltransferase|uniref:GNAT family N-acetyltransferase n=1 Tax=Pseudoclavibacter caeni TaxID=908846 RepID=A0A7C8FTP8_9MICO|nr:GNAT family N-acetyltransferase [Pseudoclavibacter caeni]KAB1631661.1 GNAT family N-acetyltransferase [Pseudoclavibacter caeni]NYJ97284.1 diamine N-acetyltransferase [Pseudoclavibacter caeni]